jgi:hypothetical protein
MSQDIQEHASDEVVSNAKARVVPFERPQSELQKAVQQRAQEAIDRERDRAAAQRPTAWRRAIVLTLAAIPVFITFGAAIGFVGALRQFNTAVFNSEVPEAPAPKTERAPETEPGVVLLQPYVMPAEPPAQDSGNPRVTPTRP